MSYLRKLFGDLRGLLRVCGFSISSIWLIRIVTNLQTIFRDRDMQSADHAMGPGPFTVRLRRYGAEFRVCGECVFSGIREMYVRDTYLHNGTLTIHDGDCVVDLGANMGNFTNLALAHGRAVRVVAVEPSGELNAAFNKSVGLNDGFLERVTLIDAFVGLMGDTQESLKNDATYASARWMSEDDLIAVTQLEKIDFLKCDIEGGEFGLFGSQSKLLNMTTSLAIEIHHFAGDVDKFINMLKECGFDILALQRDPDGTATALAKRVAAI